jgi:cytochrome c oxidase subunit IV
MVSATPGEQSASTAHDVPAELRPAHYLGVWGVLVLLTAVTVGVTFLDMKKFVVVTALTVATGKASLVLLYFMRVRFESRLIAIMVMVALAAFAIFLGLMFSDIFFRYG